MALTATAQDRLFTLDELVPGGNSYRQFAPERRFYAWWGDNLLELKAEEVCEVPLYINKVGEVLFTVDDVKAAMPEGESAFGISLYYASFPYKDKTVAVIPFSGKRLFFDFKTKKIVGEQSTIGSLEWNSASGVDAFLNDNNLWLRQKDGRETQITSDGSREIVYGQSVHRNEFGITKGTFFSPDGKRLAFYRMDQSMVEDYPQVNTFTPIATCEPDKYPMAGQVSHKVTVGIVDTDDAKKVTYLDFGDTTDRYFTNISWSPDGKKVYLIELNRLQNKATLDEYDALTGKKLRTIDTEEDEKYVEPQHPVEFLPWDDDKFLMWSQRDGFWHLYLYSNKSGKCLKDLVKDDFIVLELTGFNKEKKSVVIKAVRQPSLAQNYYSIDVETGEMTLLSNGNGVHNAELSESGQYLCDTWSAPEVPKAYSVLATSEKKTWDILVCDNPWKEKDEPQFRHGTIKAADGTTDLHYRMVLPKGFNPDDFKQGDAQLPVVVYVYGGPHAQLINESWHWAARGLEVYLAQKGYAVFVLDGRGSDNRGKAFEQVTWHQLGQQEMLDQMKGVEYLKSLPYIDKERVGVHGWSFGGYMTISLMTNYPEVFKTAVAGGPVIDWKWYEVMYGERYMGTPETNAEGYEKTSLLSKARNLKGRLLIIHGMNDPVVVPQHSLQFLYECNQARTQPDFYVYPGEEHNMLGAQQVHLQEKIVRYFDDFLK